MSTHTTLRTRGWNYFHTKFSRVVVVTCFTCCGLHHPSATWAVEAEGHVPGPWASNLISSVGETVPEEYTISKDCPSSLMSHLSNAFGSRPGLPGSSLTWGAQFGTWIHGRRLYLPPRGRANSLCKSISTLGQKGRLSKWALKGSKHALNFFRVALLHRYLHTGYSTMIIFEKMSRILPYSQKWHDSVDCKWMMPRNVGAARATLTR